MYESWWSTRSSSKIPFDSNIDIIGEGLFVLRLIVGWLFIKRFGVDVGTVVRTRLVLYNGGHRMVSDCW